MKTKCKQVKLGYYLFFFFLINRKEENIIQGINKLVVEVVYVGSGRWNSTHGEGSDRRRSVYHRTIHDCDRDRNVGDDSDVVLLHHGNHPHLDEAGRQPHRHHLRRRSHRRARRRQNPPDPPPAAGGSWALRTPPPPPPQSPPPPAALLPSHPPPFPAAPPATPRSCRLRRRGRTAGRR